MGNAIRDAHKDMWLKKTSFFVLCIFLKSISVAFSVNSTAKALLLFFFFLISMERINSKCKFSDIFETQASFACRLGSFVTIYSDADTSTYKCKTTNREKTPTNKKNYKQEKPSRGFTTSIFHSSVGGEWPLLCDTFLATRDLGITLW